MLEVTIAVLVFAVLLLATTVTFSSNLRTTLQAREMTSGSIFLETILEDVESQPYGNLLALNGNQFFDATNVNDSQFAVTLTVFLTSIDLLQVRAVLTDLRTGREVGRVTTMRANA